MHKKSFFYRFKKDRDISKSSNHSFFSENEEKASYKLASIVDKQDESRYVSFLFKNIDSEFVKDIKLLDSLMNIEEVNIKDSLRHDRIY